MRSAVRFWAAHALLPGGLTRDVTFTVDGGRFTGVDPGTAPGDAQRLPGVVLPGFADAHSHAFHRALRGRTHDVRERHVLDLARAHVRRRRPARPRLLPRPGPRRFRRERAGRRHGGGGVPLPAPRPGRAPVRRPERDGPRPGTGRRRGRDPAHPARHLLPHRGRGRPPGRRRAAPVLRRHRRRVGGAGRGAARRAGAADRGGGALGAGGTACGAARRGRGGGRPPAARPPLRAARRERRVPRRPRAHPDRAARRRGPARPGHDGRARNAPDRRRHRPAGQQPHHRLPVPHHRARPRRRPRAGACACATPGARSPSAATSTRSPTPSRRRGAWRCTSGWRRGSAAGSLRRRCSTRSPRTAVSAGTTPGAWNPGRAPTSSPSALDTPRTAGVDPAQVLLAATAADVDTVLVDGRVVVSGGRHVLGDVGALLQAAIAPLWEDA